MLGHAVVGHVKGLAKERLTLATTRLSICPTMVIWHCGEPIYCPRIPDTAPYRHSSFRWRVRVPRLSLGHSGEQSQLKDGMVGDHNAGNDAAHDPEQFFKFFWTKITLGEDVFGQGLGTASAGKCTKLRQPTIFDRKFAELKGEQNPFAGHVNPGRKREAVMYDSEADSKDSSGRWAKRFLTTEDLMRIAFELWTTQLTSIEVYLTKETGVLSRSLFLLSKSVSHKNL